MAMVFLVLVTQCSRWARRFYRSEDPARTALVGIVTVALVDGVAIFAIVDGLSKFEFSFISIINLPALIVFSVAWAIFMYFVGDWAGEWIKRPEVNLRTDKWGPIVAGLYLGGTILLFSLGGWLIRRERIEREAFGIFMDLPLRVIAAVRMWIA